MIGQESIMQRQRGSARVYAAIGGLVVGGVAGWFVGMKQGTEMAQAEAEAASRAMAVSPPPAPAPKPPPVKYGFEGQLGWTCGEERGALACKGVGHSNELHKEGVASMKVDVELLGVSKNHRSGEVWVDVNNVPPAGEPGPVSLANRTLRVWVYAPSGSLGDAERPNGFQLFVKDGDWTPKYGPWQDVRENQWSQLTFPLGGAEGDFDPAVVNAIGLKIAAGDESKAEFSGPIYVDALSW